MTWRNARTAGLIAATALALAACPDDDGDSPPPVDDALPAAVFIDEPSNDEVIVRQASFEIGGGFGGSVTEISVSIDGESIGLATPGDTGRWRLPANRVAITPGLHEITATATGEGGTDDATLWVWYETPRQLAARRA